MKTEEEIIYELGLTFSGTDIPQPVDLRNELKRNLTGKKWGFRKVEQLDGLVIHQALGNGSIEGIAKYHTGTKSHLYAGGVESLAYTIAIRKDGQVVLANPLHKATWSQGFRGIDGDENRKYIAVVLEGYFKYEGCQNDSAGEPTEEQILALLLLWRYCKGLWNWDKEVIYPHANFGKASCPGSTIESLIKLLKK